jgi:uncharacterized MAPEG superfamily protein
MAMTIPQLSLLGFALWTLFVLAVTVGVHRWSLILTGRAKIHAFPADAAGGPDWYQRATRAHLNCIENLPVFGSIVMVASFAGFASRSFDVLSVAILAARLVQTSIHVSVVQTARAVSLRFSFYSVQLLAMIVMAIMLLRAA